LPFFFFFIAMVVFLRVSVKPPAGGSLSVADAVLGLSPLPWMTMAQGPCLRNGENEKSAYISVT
jgi:hypothetical protein